MKTALQLVALTAAVIVCWWMVHKLTDPPARPSVASRYHPRVSRPVSRPNNSFFSDETFGDQSVLHHAAGVMGYGALLCLTVGALWFGIREFRNTNDITALFPFLMVAVLFFGVWAWVGYFGDHNGFLIWPVLIVAVLFVLGMVRFVVLEMRRQEEIRKQREGLQTFAPPPNTGGPASKSDFKDW